jgi:hypothetical protein
MRTIHLKCPNPVASCGALGVSVFLFLAAAPWGAWAQQSAAPLRPGHALPSPTATAVRIDEPIVVDGLFEESSWSLAIPVASFIQRDPQEGAPATERTEVRILFDSLRIYLGVFCYDSNPAGIVATELRRDDDLETDDTFEVVFDTFHDHRNGYRFRVNALGTERDELINEDGRVRNGNWDEKWDAKARITEQGWMAEIAIPFKAMRYANGHAVMEWGINFHRTITRKNEDVFWSAYNRGYTLSRMSGSGHLEGLEDIQGFRYRLKPYVSGGAFQPRSSTDLGASYRGKLGLEDFKYMLTPELTLDLTANPDFAQTDVDQAQVNLTRFSLFFPEKREFFQEASGTFQFGNPSSNDLILFHSRRIGLSDEQTEIPIMAGLKLTGTQGPLGVGLLNMQTNRKGGLPGQNFTVLRLKSNILSNSSVGFMMTRNTGSPLGGSNRALGADSSFSFLKYLTVQAFVAKTFSSGLEGQDWAGKGTITWSSDLYGFSLQHLRIQRNFSPEMGFVGRAEPGWNGLERSNTNFHYKPRPSLHWIRQFDIGTSLTYVADNDGLLDSREAQFSLNTELESGDVLNTSFSRTFNRLVEPFRIPGGGGTVPVGDYPFNEYSIQYTGYRGRKLAGSVRLERGGYYDGTITTVSLSPSVRPNSKLSLSSSFQWSQITRTSQFITRQLNTQVNYSLSQKWLTRTTLIVNSQNRTVGANFRLNYIFRPGDDLFFVYSESRGYGDTGGLNNRAFIVKMTYSLDR